MIETAREREKEEGRESAPPPPHTHTHTPPYYSLKSVSPAAYET